MTKPPDRYYQIGEVAALTGLSQHLLRQWEAKFPQLRPKRSRTNRRYYTQADIEIIRRINYLVNREKMTLDGARVRLAQELHGYGKPQTGQEMIDLADSIISQVRGMLDLIDRTKGQLQMPDPPETR